MSGAPTFGDSVLRIAPDQIVIPERLGLYFPDKAAALGRMMAVAGQRTPLTVRKSGPRAALPWTLVVGRHRLGGALLEQLPHVLAIEVSQADADELMDIEASENVHRREQPPLERAIFIHATCAAAKARLEREHGVAGDKQLAAKSRWDRVKSGALRAEQVLQEESNDAAAKIAAAYDWQESVADAFGLGIRSIRNALQLYRLVIEPFPALTQALSDHPVVGNNASQLKLIAEVQDEAQRRQVIEQLLGNPELSADGARIALGIDREDTRPTPVGYEKYLSQIEGGWARLDLARKREFVPTLARMLGTPDLKRAMRDRLNDELGEISAPPGPTREIGVEQAADVLAEAIGMLNKLIDGEPVDDDELGELRRAAQGVVFDIPREAAPVRFERGTLAEQYANGAAHATG